MSQTVKMKWFDLTFFQSFFEIIFDRPRLTKVHLLPGENICFGIYLVRLDVLLQDLKQEIRNRNVRMELSVLGGVIIIFVLCSESTV